MQQHAFRAMGCQILAIVDQPGPGAAAALAETAGWFEEWEQQLSRFRADSALARLNRDGTLRNAPPALWAAVRLALETARETAGLVTPTVLPALLAHGYDRTFDQIGVAGEPAAALPAPDWASVVLDAATRSIHLLAGTQLDLGGIAKGWAANEALLRLRAHGPALVDAGGDIALSGPRADGGPWPIAIADPRQPDSDLALLMLSGGGVATSGSDYRRWRSAQGWQHHLIDPRTGRPAQTDVLSATVIAANVIRAEAAAKQVFLRGRAAGLDWLNRQPGCAGVAVTVDGEIHATDAYPAFLWTPS